jgi:hypothetical protein
MLSQPAHLPQLPRELAHRSDDGLEVVLLWDPTDGGATVIVADTRTGATLELALGETDDALDAFYHPFSYAEAPRPERREAGPDRRVPADEAWVRLRREGRRSPL